MKPVPPLENSVAYQMGFQLSFVIYIPIVQFVFKMSSHRSIKEIQSIDGARAVLGHDVVCPLVHQDWWQTVAEGMQSETRNSPS